MNNRKPLLADNYQNEGRVIFIVYYYIIIKDNLSHVLTVANAIRKSAFDVVYDPPNAPKNIRGYTKITKSNNNPQ